jgi:hypothetical protein
MGHMDLPVALAVGVVEEAEAEAELLVVALAERIPQGMPVAVEAAGYRRTELHRRQHKSTAALSLAELDDVVAECQCRIQIHRKAQDQGQNRNQLQP